MDECLNTCSTQMHNCSRGGKRGCPFCTATASSQPMPAEKKNCGHSVLLENYYQYNCDLFPPAIDYSYLYGYRFGGPSNVELKTVDWHETIREEAMQMAAEAGVNLDDYLFEKYGLREEPSPFFSLSYWNRIEGPLRGIHLDLMHIMYNCVTSIFFKLLTGDKVKGGQTAKCTLSNGELAKVQARFNSLRLPSPYTESMKHLLRGVKEGRRGLGKAKTIDYVKVVQLRLLPYALVDIVSPTVFGCIAKLCRALRLFLAHEITEDSIRKAEVFLWEALKRFEALVPDSQRRGWQWHFLLHLPNYLRSEGPLVDGWNFRLESYLATFRAWVKSMRFPIQSLANAQNVRIAVASLKVRDCNEWSFCTTKTSFMHV